MGGECRSSWQSLQVQRELYYGQLPVPRISGFKDEMTGKVITNAFEFGMLDPNEVADNWLKLNDEDEAPIRPVIVMRGLIAWTWRKTASVANRRPARAIPGVYGITLAGGAAADRGMQS
jgi:hypothetical protein